MQSGIGVRVCGRGFIISPLFLVFLPFLYFFGPYKKRRKVLLGGRQKAINAYVADNFFARAIGYMFRDPRDVKKDEGMLFVFSEPRTVSFWMLDVHFPVKVVSLDYNESIIMRPHTLAIHPLRGRLFLEQKYTNAKK